MHLSGCWFWIACCRAGSTQGHCKANRKGNTLFFNQDFLHWAVRHHCLNNRCPHLQPWWWGWRSGGSSRPGCLPHRKVGKEDCSHGWALLSSLWDAEGMPEGSRNVCTDICSCTPPPPQPPSVVYFPGKKMRRIIPCLEKSCLCYCLGQLSLGSSETVVAGAKPVGPAIWDAWPWGRVLHKPHGRAGGSEGFTQMISGSMGLQPWRVFWCDSKGSLWHRILSMRESM